MQRAVSAAEAGVRVELVGPPAPQPGAPVRLIYRLADAASGAPLTDVVISHEQPVHLIAVSWDLARFQHVHPLPTGQPGEYALEVAFPEAGSYVLYAEFTRASGQDVVQRDVLTVGPSAGATPAPGRERASLAEERAPKIVSNDARVALQGAGAIQAGQEARLTFRLDNPVTGEGVGDLRPYLGAPAHVVILSEDVGTFAHTHGEQVGASAGDAHGEEGGSHGGHDAAGATYGPEIAFHHTFSAPGLYKVWGQFQDHHGQVITADFVVRAN